MKAGVFEKIGVYKLKEVPMPEIDDNSALMRVRACAICGSDIRIIKHGHPLVNPPHIIGHEISGDIVEVGKNVTKFKVGDRVAVGADLPCGQCAMCENGHGNYCENEDGMGYTLAGGFAEYCVLNEKVMMHGPVHLIPDEMSYEAGALAEPVGCLLNGMERVKPELNDTAVILGAGPLGCMMIPVLYRYGCSKVIIVNRSPERIELAKRFNADCYIVSSQEDALAKVMEETNGMGADIVITANPDGQSHTDAIKMAGIHGKILLFGGLPEGSLVEKFDTNTIHYKELTVVGCHGSVPRQHKTAIDMIAAGNFPIDQIVTHRYSLDDIEEAFAMAMSHYGLKIIVNP